VAETVTFVLPSKQFIIAGVAETVSDPDGCVIVTVAVATQPFASETV